MTERGARTGLRETWIGSKLDFRLPSPRRKRLVLKFPKGKLARSAAPHFEAWKLDSGAKVTGRIKMAEGSVRS